MCLLALLTNWTKFARISYGIRTNFVQTNVLGKCVNTKVSVKFVQNSYEFRTSFTLISVHFVQLVYRLRSVLPMVVASALPLLQVVPHTLCLVCRCPSTRGRRRCGNTPAGGSPCIIACWCPLRSTIAPKAPGLDGPLARPQVSAARPPRARDTLRGAAARQARVRGIGVGRA